MAPVCDLRLLRLNEICEVKISAGYATELLLAPSNASELVSGFLFFHSFIIFCVPLFEFIGPFFSENLHLCPLGEMRVVSDYCISIIYPVAS